MAVMLQHLLDSGYYIVPTDDRFADELMRLLEYNGYREKSGSRVFYRVPQSGILDSKQAMVHRAFINRLPARGIDIPAITLGPNFSLQYIIQPDSAPQHLSATVFSDLHLTLGSQGMEAHCVDSVRNEYIFQYGNNNTLCTSPRFIIKPGIVNYIAITVGDSALSVYVNGIRLPQTLCKGDYANSDRPFMIGNNRARNAPFNGMIYEIQVSNSIISKAEITQTDAKVRSQMR
jgi:hypothetical protein